MSSLRSLLGRQNHKTQASTPTSSPSKPLYQEYVPQNLIEQEGEGFAHPTGWTHTPNGHKPQSQSLHRFNTFRASPEMLKASLTNSRNKNPLKSNVHLPNPLGFRLKGKDRYSNRSLNTSSENNLKISLDKTVQISKSHQKNISFVLRPAREGVTAHSFKTEYLSMNPKKEPLFQANSSMRSTNHNSNNVTPFGSPAKQNQNGSMVSTSVNPLDTFFKNLEPRKNDQPQMKFQFPAFNPSNQNSLPQVTSTLPSPASFSQNPLDRPSYLEKSRRADVDRFSVKLDDKEGKKVVKGQPSALINFASNIFKFNQQTKKEVDTNKEAEFKKYITHLRFKTAVRRVILLFKSKATVKFVTTRSNLDPALLRDPTSLLQPAAQRHLHLKLQGRRDSPGTAAPVPKPRSDIRVRPHRDDGSPLGVQAREN